MEASLSLDALQESVNFWRWRKRRMRASLLQRVQPQRIDPINRMVPNIQIEIQRIIRRSLIVGVFANKSTDRGVIVAMAEVVQIGLGIELTSRELEVVADRAG
jgi:hypothetical protein